MGRRKKTKTPSEQILALMRNHEPPVKQTDLARDMNTNRMTVWRRLKRLDEGILDDGDWNQLASTLRAYGIDVSDVRAGTVGNKPAVVVADETLAVDTSLVSRLELFATEKQLKALVDILGARQAARDLLLVVATDRLARR